MNLKVPYHFEQTSFYRREKPLDQINIAFFIIIWEIEYEPEGLEVNLPDHFAQTSFYRRGE